MEVKALQQILSQFRQMQESLQKQVEAVHVEASAGGGMVTVKMNGQKQVTEVRIDPEVFAGKDRSEERRVGKEGRDRGAGAGQNKKKTSDSGSSCRQRSRRRGV